MTQISEMLEEERLVELREQLRTAVHRVCPPWLADQADELADTVMAGLLQRPGTDLAELDPTELGRVAHAALVREIGGLRAARAADRVASGGGASGASSGGGASGAGSASPGSAPGPSPGSPADLAPALAACLPRLAPQRAQAVTLYLLGHTVPDIGRLLGQDTQRAEDLVHRGLADLRACMGAPTSTGGDGPDGAGAPGGDEPSGGDAP